MTSNQHKDIFARESLILYLLITIGLITALLAVKSRYSVEARNKRTEIVVDYSDALNLALGARQPFPKVLGQLKSAGVTTLALWEDPLDSLRLEGAMSVNAIDAGHTMLTFSPSFPGEEQRAILALKNKTSVAFTTPSTDTIQIAAPYVQIQGVGVGLDPTQINQSISAGFLISPRIYNYSGVTPTAIGWMIDQIKMQCRSRANVVIFNGPDVLGNRGDIDATANALRADGLLYGSLELGKQGGDDVLSRLGADITVRVHSIGGNEMPTMDEPTAVGRFALAAREREIRSCYVRLFQNSLDAQPDVMAANIGYIKDIVTALQSGGIRLGPAHPFTKDPRPERLRLVFMALGVAAGLVLLVRQFTGLSGTGFWLSLIMVAGATAFLSTRQTTLDGRLVVALLAGMTFPSLSMILCRPVSRRGSKSKLKAFDRALLTYAKMAAITVVGIVFVVGMLADRLMILKVSEFMGIRLAIITPLFLVVIHEGFGLSTLHAYDGWAERKAILLSRWRGISESPVKVGQLVFGLIGLAILGYIVMRTGNDPGISVSGSERSARAILSNLLTVRPRTKEFLFGYPLMLVGLALYYSGRRQFYLIFACAGAIAQADLLNTFCHIHTPISISIIRALLGWTIGWIFGAILYAIAAKYLPPAPPEMDTIPASERRRAFDNRVELETVTDIQPIEDPSSNSHPALSL